MDNPIDRLLSNKNNKKITDPQRQFSPGLKKLFINFRDDPILNTPPHLITKEQRKELYRKSDEIKREGEELANIDNLKKQEKVRESKLSMSSSDIELYSIRKYNKNKNIYKENERLCDFLITGNSFRRNKGLFLYGNTGIGKSHALKTFALSQVYQKQNTQIIDYPTAIRDLIYNQKRFGSEEKFYEKMHELKKADVLIIDQFDSYSVIPNHAEVLREILNNRFDSSKRTYFSSDLEPEQICEKLDKNILSLILGLSQPTLMKGNEDLRVKMIS